MRRPLVRWALGVGIALAALLFLTGIILTCNPNLIIGRYALVKITSVTFDGQGGASVSSESTCPANTWQAFRTVTDGVGRDQGGAGGGSGFPGFSSRVTMTVGCDLVGPKDRGSGRPVPDREALAKRILVQVGRKYRVGAHRPLTVYRFTDGEGHVHEGQIVIYPEAGTP